MDNTNKKQTALNELLRGVSYLIDKALSHTTKCYNGFVIGTPVSGKWLIKMNGEDRRIAYYGKGAPILNSTVKVIVPQGNMNLAYFFMPDSSGGGSVGVNSFNGRTGAVYPQVNDYTPSMVGAMPKEAKIKLTSIWKNENETLDFLPQDIIVETQESYVVVVRKNKFSSKHFTYFLLNEQGILPQYNEGFEETGEVGLYSIYRNISAKANIDSTTITVSEGRMIKSSTGKELIRNNQLIPAEIFKLEIK